jgi:hypothetical protein
MNNHLAAWSPGRDPDATFVTHLPDLMPVRGKYAGGADSNSLVAVGRIWPGRSLPVSGSPGADES